MFRQVRIAIGFLGFMTLLCGVAYPILVMALGQLAFNSQANGSLIYNGHGEVLGSALIAQPISGPQWFMPRPSAGEFATLPSAASNLGASHPRLAQRVSLSAQQWLAAGYAQPVPMQLVSTSASGLDPDLSPEAAAYQAASIAHARQIPVHDLLRLIHLYTERPLVGPAVVNVLRLNLALMDTWPSIRRQ